MKKLILFIYLLWVGLVFTTFMIILLPVFILPILLGQKYGYITYIGLYLWSRIFSILTFIHYKSIGLKNFDHKRSYIYTSNHTSFLDIPGVVRAIPGQFRPLAKKELLKVPVFGWIVNVACVLVDRSSPESRKESGKLLKERIKAGISLLIFAEGTQNRSKELMLPFYDGAFRISKDTDTEILPMVILNAGKLMPPGKINVRPGKILIVFGEPISPDQFRTPTEMKEYVRNIMLKMISDYQDK
ncbi:MAG: lysophospholipid acyltransferase family protein [Cyclobacteriaceae bacterium]